MEKPPFQFGLKAVFVAMAVFAIWVAVFSKVRDWNPFVRDSILMCLTLSYSGLGLMAYAARPGIFQNRRPEASRLLFVLLGMCFMGVAAMLLCMAFASPARYLLPPSATRQ